MNTTNNQVQLRLRKRFSSGSFSEGDGLHPRDIAIVNRLAAGDSSKQIADKSNLSCRTIEKAIDDMRIKYGCVNRCHLVAKFFREGWIS